MALAAMSANCSLSRTDCRAAVSDTADSFSPHPGASSSSAEAGRWLNFLASEGVRPKLTVSDPGDRDEREADALADRVLGMTRAASAPLGAGEASARDNRLARACCASCEKEHGTKEDDDGRVHRKARGPSAAEGAVQAAAEAVSSGGQPLGSAERGFFEPRFGRDLSEVRVHTGTTAARAARNIDAYAYASGAHIAFGAGQYRPHTHEGRKLLAHELAHVVQQEARGPPRLARQVIAGIDLKVDPCVILPDPVGEKCGQSAAEACKAIPSLPGCSQVCKVFDCTKPSAPKTLCPPNWRVGTSSGFSGQCCKGGIDNAKSCCPPDRISWMEDRCCPAGEVVIENKCVKPSAAPVVPCLPGQSTLTGECCVKPMVPQGMACVMPGAGPAPPPAGPLPPTPQLGILWTDEIHFRQNHPSAGEKDPAAILTPEGVIELDPILLWMKVSSDLEVRLVGHASSEGEPPYNQDLATRRTRFIVSMLAAQGFSGRIADPLADDGAGAGCTRLGAGQWSCGEQRADPSAARPEERVVRVTFLRNRLPPLQ